MLFRNSRSKALWSFSEGPKPLMTNKYLLAQDTLGKRELISKVALLLLLLLLFVWFFFFFWIQSLGSIDWLEPFILLPQLPEHWDYRRCVIMTQIHRYLYEQNCRKRLNDTRHLSIICVCHICLSNGQLEWLFAGHMILLTGKTHFHLGHLLLSGLSWTHLGFLET